MKDIKPFHFVDEPPQDIKIFDQAKLSDLSEDQSAGELPLFQEEKVQDADQVTSCFTPICNWIGHRRFPIH